MLFLKKSPKFERFWLIAGKRTRDVIDHSWPAFRLLSVVWLTNRLASLFVRICRTTLFFFLFFVSGCLFYCWLFIWFGFERMKCCSNRNGFSQFRFDLIGRRRVTSSTTAHPRSGFYLSSDWQSCCGNEFAGIFRIMLLWHNRRNRMNNIKIECLNRMFGAEKRRCRRRGRSLARDFSPFSKRKWVSLS